MDATADRTDLAPPSDSRPWPSLGLAMLAHALLVGALAWGVAWQRDAATPAVEAELWSAVPVAAAPRAQALPEPQPAPVVPPKPVPPPPPPPDPAPQQDVRIALERQKKAAAEQAARLEQERARQAARQRAEAEAADKKKRADDARRQEAAAAERAEKELKAQREANLRRMAGLANATGAETATGTAPRAAGPSASYGGRVAAAVKPNIVYPEAVTGNPRALVEVRTAFDGAITSRKLLESSGNRAWDDAVLRALDKTEKMPRDVDGRVPPVIEIGFRPRD